MSCRMRRWFERRLIFGSKFITQLPQLGKFTIQEDHHGLLVYIDVHLFLERSGHDYGFEPILRYVDPIFRCIAQHFQLFGSRIINMFEPMPKPAKRLAVDQVEKSAYVETIHKPALAQSL